MGTGASQIFVEQLREGLGILGVQIPSYLHAPLNANQASPSGHVEWRDTGDIENGGWQSSGDITVSTGAGQLAGIVTLPAGKVWLVQAHLAASFTGITGLLGCQWGFAPPIPPPFEDPFGNRTNLRPLSQAIDERGVEICSAIFDSTAGAIVVRCQILNVTNVAAILDWNSGGSFAFIRSL